MNSEHFVDLVPDGLERVQVALWVLEDEADLLAEDASQLFVGGRHLHGHDLDGDDAMQLLIERAQDGAVAALAEHAQHLVTPQPAERTRLRGRLQDFERRRPIVLIRFRFRRSGFPRSLLSERQRLIRGGVHRQGAVGHVFERRHHGPSQDTGGRLVCDEQRIDAPAQVGIGVAFLIQIRCPLRGAS